MLERQIYDWEQSNEKECVYFAPESGCQIFLNEDALIRLLFGLDLLSSTSPYGEDTSLNSDQEPDMRGRELGNATRIGYMEIMVIPLGKGITDSLTADKRIRYDHWQKTLILYVTRAEAADAYESLERLFLREVGGPIIDIDEVILGPESVTLFGIMTVTLVPDPISAES